MNDDAMSGAPEQDETAATVRDELAARIGKSRAEWEVDDLVAVVREHDIRLVSLVHVGGDGWLKSLDFVPRDEAHLRDVIEGGERADGSSLFPDSGPGAGASDIVLRPRVQRAFLDPFASLPTLALLCGHCDRDGQPLAVSPDTVVRRAHARVREACGVDLHALGEVEFYLGKAAADVDVYGADDRGYHATSPFVFGEELRRRAMVVLTAIGVDVKYGHAEVGCIEAEETEGGLWEQHEIELALAPLPDAADAIVLTQWVVRNLAHDNGMRCNTDPMLLAGHPGNGMHFHFSPVQDGRHLAGRDDEGELTAPARWLLGGLVETAAALMAFGNRTKESFTRLQQAREAPSTIVWGEYDRSALVRLPLVTSTADGREVTAPTIEFRLSDSSALPHLVLAGAAQAMVHARGRDDLDALLARTRSRHVAEGKGEAAPVPSDPAGVAEALAAQHETLEAGGVFPAELLDGMIAGLAG